MTIASAHPGQAVPDHPGHQNVTLMRLELLAGAAANSQLVFACVHSRVVEMVWADGGSAPSQITVDEVVA